MFPTWMTETFTLLNASTESDGMGGVNTTYTNGSSFEAAITKDKSQEALVAYRDSEKISYVILTQKQVLKLDDRIVRNRDSMQFRVTSDSEEQHTPSISSMDFYRCTAEVVK